MKGNPAYIRSEWYSFLECYALIWWAELDSNQRCQKNLIYSQGWYQLHSIDPYILKFGIENIYHLESLN